MSDQVRERTLSMSFVEALCRDMGVPTLELLQALESLDLSDTATRACVTELTTTQFTQLYRLLIAPTDDEMRGLFPRPFRRGAFRLTSMTLLDGDTLGKAFRRWSHLLRQLQDSFVLDMEMVDGRCTLAVRPTDDAVVLKPLATDLFIKLVHGMACWLTGKDVGVRRVLLRTSRAHTCGDLPTWFSAPVRFEQTYSALEVDETWLMQPVVRGKQDLGAFMDAAPGNWIAAQFDEERLHVRLRRHLAGLLPVSATAEGAAAALHLSTRSLHRRLHQEQTTFQRVKDELRRDLAMTKLTRGTQPISAIAFELGFDSITSFHRAFKGWTGETPGGYRLQRQHVQAEQATFKQP